MNIALHKFELHLDINTEDSRVIGELNQKCSLSNAQLKQAIQQGALWLTRGKSTQRLRRIKKPLQIADTLHFYYDEQVLSQQPNEALLMNDCVDYSVWYKPYGMLSQGSKWSDHCTIARWAQTHLTPERPAFIVHRLDRAATGLILIAHSKKAARALSAMFEKHDLEKTYHIIIHGDHRLRPQPDALTSDVDGKSASSHFSHLAYNEENNTSLVQVIIDTGRKHQIRSHAASINMPVVGDRLHGKVDDKAESINLQLCAVALNFICPLSAEQRSFKVPEHLMPSLNVLG
ncbi:RluA family pseudouridine synthase [Colwellia hornerae]|uniref:RNA pseudouridine synthase n=1 Tax=Colwellia hornerae TaxID=89402 RepID=A0A5C6Q4N4_9GAMM|nr:RNA pseudouridine synthase [Colwellia hornerae]TWX48072.1 RNA pseudouridine synthase [Colwellia hornerae]TWX54891.1 RNA pseudouridine synthase [Colwellia hornerae]TWX63749.1 RNA pseudouridine synthase [Colwellia hornerae]